MALQNGDDSSLADALPGQPERESIELGVAQAQRRAAVPGPGELAAVQTPCGEPYADAVVDEGRTRDRDVTPRWDEEAD